MEIKITGKQIALTLTIGIPVLVAAVGWAYKYGLDVNAANLKHKTDIVQEYERSTQLNAPNLVATLNQSAEALTLSALERKALTTAQNRVEEYAKTIGTQKVKISELNEKNLKLSEDLASNEKQYSIHLDRLKNELNSFLLESSEIIAKRGVALELIPNHAMLGLSSVYEDRIVVNINGNRVFLDLGESHFINYANSSCNLWLTKIKATTPEEAEFKLVCNR